MGVRDLYRLNHIPAIYKSLCVDSRLYDARQEMQKESMYEQQFIHNYKRKKEQEKRSGGGDSNSNQ